MGNNFSSWVLFCDWSSPPTTPIVYVDNRSATEAAIDAGVANIFRLFGFKSSLVWSYLVLGVLNES